MSNKKKNSRGGRGGNVSQHNGQGSNSKSKMKPGQTRPATELNKGKVLEVMLKCKTALAILPVDTLWSLRKVSRSVNDEVKSSKAFLDRVRFRISCATSKAIFCNSTVQWSNLLIQWWPGGMYKFSATEFWNGKGQDVASISLGFKPSNEVTLLNILSGPKKLTSLEFLVDLSYLNLPKVNAQLKEGFQKAMASVAVVKFFTNVIQKYNPNNPNQFSCHMNNIKFLLSFIPKFQLIGFEIEAMPICDSTDFDILGQFAYDILDKHQLSLKTFKYAPAMPTEWWNNICTDIENLQLKSLKIDLLSTIHEYEKSRWKLLRSSDWSRQQLGSHLLTFRKFIKFLQLQQSLQNLDILVSKFTKKVAGKILSETLCNSLVELQVFSFDFSSDTDHRDALHYLGKIKNLERLHLELEVNSKERKNRFILNTSQDVLDSFFVRLPTTLREFSLTGFNDFSAVCLKFFLERFPNLRTLSIVNCKKLLNNDGLVHIIRHGKNLKSLYLVPAKEIDDYVILGDKEINLSKLAGLVNLSLPRAKITVTALRFGIALLPNLVNLDISGCHKITSRGVLDLAQQTQSRRLSRIHISSDLYDLVAKKLAKTNIQAVSRPDETVESVYLRNVNRIDLRALHKDKDARFSKLTFGTTGTELSQKRKFDDTELELMDDSEDEEDKEFGPSEHVLQVKLF